MLYLEQVNRSPATLDSYGRDLKLFINWCNINKLTQLSKVRPQDISNYFDFLKYPSSLSKRDTFFSAPYNVTLLQAPLAVNSRKRHLSTIKNFYAFLKDKHPRKHILHWGFRQGPVLEKLHSIRLKDEDLLHTPLLREVHWKNILEVPLKGQDRLLLYLMYWGGLRLSEARTLRVNQLNTHTNVLTLFRKGGKRHELFLQDKGVCCMQWENLTSNWLQSENYKDQAPFLFSGRIPGRAISRRAAFKKVKKIFKKAGVPQNLSPHSLRKACATRLYYKTRDLLFVRDYLGHSDAKVTQTYIETQGLALEVLNENTSENIGTSSPLSLKYTGINKHSQESYYN